MNNKSKKKSTAAKIVFWSAFFVFAAGLAAVVYILFNSYFVPEKETVSVSSYNTQTESKRELPENPVNFTLLKQQNSDIYAWIRIPNTKIDYPVLQNPDPKDSEDEFYLHHDENKKYRFAGSIYSQKGNSTDFSDRNTILYGHNMLNGSMFQNLHKFRNADFFNSNETIYIYTPGHILTYKIFAAYKYDDRHILNAFNFSDDKVFSEYLDYVKNPKSMIVNKRDVDLDLNSKLLTLSTCIGNEGNYRYLVQGVLIKDEPTK